MNLREFNDFVSMKKKIKPILFGLESDKIADEEDIKTVEEYYGIQLPASYKEFVQEYGGGYFAHSIIYSCDENSDFYLLSNNPIEFVGNNNFIAVSDLGTGDLFGFSINKNICDARISIYDHEKKSVVETDMHDIFEFISKYGLKIEI